MSEAVQTWFDQKQRDLPWRRDRRPYSVWVSEIMLQQTRVTTVIPYFERWMETFPTIEALAAAPIEQVVKQWEGLGYYRRARNLHAGAKEVVERYGGELPSDERELLAIRGIGRYTAGAIRAFAFRQRAAAVDGNVIRVMSRYWAIDDSFSSVAAVRSLSRRVEEFLPEGRPWVVSEGLMELGATLCTPTDPKCSECPLHTRCAARQMGRQVEFPELPPRAKATELRRLVGVLHCGDHLLLRCVPPGEVMADLYQFPYVEQEEGSEALFALLGSVPKKGCDLSTVTHSFTRYRAHLSPSLYSVDDPIEVDGYDWFGWEEQEKLPFSSGHRRIYTEWRAQ
jgi:A/G-specific adenine glycosylase